MSYTVVSLARIENSTMKLYLDTANIKEIQEAASLGVLDGVTTNPSLVAKEDRSFRDALVEISRIVEGPINPEVVSLDADTMVKDPKQENGGIYGTTTSGGTCRADVVHGVYACC